MRTTARLATIVCVVGATAGTSRAAGRRLEPFPANLPAKCARVAWSAPSAKTADPAIAAHVSVANCLAEEEMNHVEATGTDDSITQLEDAVQPSLEMLDHVIALGDPYWTMVAQDAVRDIYAGMVVRERAAFGNDAAAIALLEPKVAPWEIASHMAAVEVEHIAKQHPELASRDPVIAKLVARDGAPAKMVGRR